MTAIVLKEDDTTTIGVPLTLVVARPSRAHTVETDKRVINGSTMRVPRMSVAKIIFASISRGLVITCIINDLEKSRRH